MSHDWHLQPLAGFHIDFAWLKTYMGCKCNSTLIIIMLFWWFIFSDSFVPPNLKKETINRQYRYKTIDVLPFLYNYKKNTDLQNIFIYQENPCS